MTRYLVVAHTNYGHQLPVHQFLKSHRWEMITPGYAFVKADIESRHLNVVAAHPAVLMLPSLFSPLSVGVQASQQGKHGHLQALVSSGVAATETAASVVIGAVAKFGRKFGLES